jgi:biopolymer transport protein TolR
MPKLQAIPSAGRPGRGRRVATTLVEINVIPLVDIMLVLLIIFMVTAPMIQRGIDVKVPVASKTNQISGERVFVTIPEAYRTNRFVYLGEEPVKLDYLQERVRQKMENATDKQVYLKGDAGIRYQDLMEVFDKLNAAGVRSIGMISRLPTDK